MRKLVVMGMSALFLFTALTGCGSKQSVADTTVATTVATEAVTTVATGETSVASTAEAERVTVAEGATEDAELEVAKEALRQQFLTAANEVIVTDDSVTFTDASGAGEPVTIAKNPEKVVNLYSSFTTLWYEAGGVVDGCIGGSSAVGVYEEYIGRDITADEGMTVVATSAAGKKWDVETIIAMQPDLIICSTAMSGYDTINSSAQSAGIPVIVVNYNDFSDYLKWFKVFCNLNGQQELWESVAMKSLEEVVDVLTEAPKENNPRVFCMFASADALSANTSNTVVGGMITAMNAVNIVDEWENTTNADRLDINLETVFAADPDMIVIQCHAGEEGGKELVATLYGDNPVWQSLSAVKNGKVFYLEKTLFHNKPNSRFAEAYQKLAAVLYPEIEFSFQAKGK